MKLILGPPSSGKTQIVKFLVNEFNMIHINLFKILQSRKKRDPQIYSILESGDNLPIEVIKILIEDELRLKKSKGINFSNILLEGYPITIESVSSIFLFKIESVIWLECPEEECIKRMINLYKKPNLNSYLISNIRYYNWKQTNKSIYWFYKLRGNLTSFNTMKPKHEVMEEIANKIFYKSNYKISLNIKGEPIFGQTIDWEFINNTKQDYYLWKRIYYRIWYYLIFIFKVNRIIFN